MATSRPPERKMIPTRILIVSDTHAHLPLGANEGSPVPFRRPLPEADVLIHCGDLTMNGEFSQHERAVDLLTSATTASLKIVIPGNHDLTLDRDYYRRFPTLHTTYGPYPDATLDRIRALYTGPRARDAGIHYLEEGVARFTLRNGARLAVYASAYQPEFCNWAFGYPRSVDRFNHNPRPGGGGTGPECPVPDHGEIDIMVTHGPPHGILDRVWRGGVAGEGVGCDHLRRAVERCRPRIHCFGHIHEAWGAVWKRWDSDVGTPALPPQGRDITMGDDKAPSSLAGVGEPNPPYHPVHNPNSYYMYPDTDTSKDTKQNHSNQALRPGETLLQPGPYYEDQVRRRCATVDARGLEFGRETLFVNASIMNLRYRPANAPWLVDVMLPEDAAAAG
ncbi:hypothetical protein AYL99_10343 [Fonsecaea erecta]|uniref:Calcineurin-like phosphoesterase domain-containing protein n=1 Tax=Fonsecaea erecta TaxID=1367422 RepID=A0A178Z6G7_9EURO|nr:hypothetical protein AYL99_10343 [Fonsecaea erecta]OAP55370.1 hypothetical protein AYL99_10343 [Fonsecaea erecta]